MNVELIANTAVPLLWDGEYDIRRPTDQWLNWEAGVNDADHLAEFAGRACYQSFDRPNPATAKNRDYIASIIDKGHESVLEHASATFYITGVSRSLTHELIRHRHLSVSELSQRYVDVEDAQLVTPPALNPGPFPNLSVFEKMRTEYAGIIDYLTELRGLPRKRAREAARSVMPNCTETRIVVSGNHRAWRHVIRLRGSEYADAEFRGLALVLLDKLYEIAPATFADFSVVTLADGREVVE